MAERDFQSEVRDELKLNRAALYDFRQVNRTLVVEVHENVALTRENVALTREVLHEVRELRSEVRAMHDDIREELQGMREDIREMSRLIKGLTDAVLLVLDRLDGSGGPSSATA